MNPPTVSRAATMLVAMSIAISGNGDRGDWCITYVNQAPSSKFLGRSGGPIRSSNARVGSYRRSLPAYSPRPHSLEWLTFRFGPGPMEREDLAKDFVANNECSSGADGCNDNAMMAPMADAQVPFDVALLRRNRHRQTPAPAPMAISPRFHDRNPQ